MRLAKLAQFREMVYAPGSAPALKTLRARIERGDLAGGTVDGGRYYVDLDEWERRTRMRQNAEADRNEIVRENAELLDGLV